MTQKATGPPVYAVCFLLSISASNDRVKAKIQLSNSSLATKIDECVQYMWPHLLSVSVMALLSLACFFLFCVLFFLIVSFLFPFPPSPVSFLLCQFGSSEKTKLDV